MRYKFFILLFFFLTYNFCFSQRKAEIFTGRLIDSKTSESISDVNIYSNSRYAAISDRDGYFSMYVFPDDTLTVSCIGYQSIHIIINKLKESFKNKIVIYKLIPIIYTLPPVEIHYPYSVVVLPEDKRKKVEIEGLENDNVAPKIDINEKLNIKFEKENNLNKSETPELKYFGAGITINGFLSNLMNKDTKKERIDKLLIETDKKTEFFIRYVLSENVKTIIMNNPYNYSEEKYRAFIDNFIEHGAGKVKYSTNEYDILKKIIDNLSIEKK